MMDYRFMTPEVIVQAIIVGGLLAFAMVLCLWTIRCDNQRRKTHPLGGVPVKPSIDSRLPIITTPPISREQWKRMMR
jgi:hypothetical protein